MSATTGRHRLPRRRSRRAWITALIVFVLVGGVAAAADASRPGSGRATTLVGLYTGHERPGHPAAPDPKAVELGVQFTVSRPGSVVAIRYYKSRLNRGQHTGTLWTASGVELATVVFTDEHRSGWQMATFAKPVHGDAGRHLRRVVPHQLRPLRVPAERLRRRPDDRQLGHARRPWRVPVRA